MIVAIQSDGVQGSGLEKRSVFKGLMYEKSHFVGIGRSEICTHHAY